MTSLQTTSAEKDGINGIQNKWMRLMRNNIIYLICAACLVAACAEEQRFENINPTPGVEVAFSAITNESPETKTLYGTDADDKTGLKVKWVNGDKIKIYGTTCSVKEAEYSVQATTAATNTPNTDDGQNYADDLIKTGAAGVQWGSEETSDFYAVYPSDGASFTQNSDGSVKINTTINATQNYLFNDEPTTIGNLTVWEGTHFGSDATDPSMLNAIMYAYTKGATPTDESGNTQQVDLHFKPFSTVFKFRFMGYTSELSNVTDPTVYVQSITITAPEGYNISGDFSLAIAGDGGKDVSATATATGNNSNSITLNTILAGGTYLPLRQNQAVDFNVFTIPLENLMLGGDITKKEVTNTDGTKKTYVTCEHPWKVTIKTQAHGTFEYTVIPNVEGITELAVGSTLTAKAYELNAGHIHKIKVPKLTLKTEFEWDPENWITQIPTPVYISELSVPGAWYAYDRMPDGSAVKFKYQNGASLSELYSAGVRAFHLDCRASKVPGRFNLTSAYSYGDNVYLACAGTENGVGASTNTQLIYEGVYVLDALKDLVKLAVTHPKEYIVVVLTIAEKQYVNSSKNFGTIRPDVVIPLIKEVLANTDDISYTLTNEDGTTTAKTTTIAEAIYTEITKDTVIEDVLGRVIVKVNLNTDNFASYEIPTLTSFGSLAAEYSDVGVTEINKEDTLYESYFAKMNSTTMYIGKEDAELSFHYHQAQRTLTDGSTAVAGIPHYSDRKSAIDAIISQSKAVYDAGTHDAWFQIGIGGSRKDASDSDSSASQDEVATTLNTYLYDKIVAKMNTDPSPVGIVLMNNCTSTSGQSLIKAIIEMNGKFYLNRQGGSIITGDGTGSGSGSTTSTKNAAYAVVGDNAF